MKPSLVAKTETLVDAWI